MTNHYWVSRSEFESGSVEYQYAYQHQPYFLKDAMLVDGHELLSYSEYSGTTVERCNVKVWQDRFGERLGISWAESYGAYGTVQILIKGTELNEDEREFLDSLEDYPVIDEDLLSSMELESQEEAWESWVRADFVRSLRDYAEDEDIADSMSDDELRELFEVGRELANEYWIDETGGNAYIRLDPILAALAEAKKV